MLNRRDFLRFGGTGLSSIALLSLLGEQKLLASGPPIRPQWSPENPYAPRPPHFTPKAKNVLVIFCSGACSHLETWDYKPELVKRHGTPMPGIDKATGRVVAVILLLLLAAAALRGYLPGGDRPPRGQPTDSPAGMFTIAATLAVSFAPRSAWRRRGERGRRNPPSGCST